jgi:hypothetical protein
MGAFDELIEELILQIDLSVVLVVQLVTGIVRSTLNIWSVTRDVYTDWMIPYVACLVGILFGFARKGWNLEAILYGLVLGGGAVFFSQLWNKGMAGMSVLRGKDKADPVIKAKVEKTSTSADCLVEAMKARLHNHKSEQDSE